MQKEYLFPIFDNVLSEYDLPDGYELVFELPKNPDHGDLATNIAMRLARPLKKNPRQIAEEIIEKLDYDKDIIDEISIAGPGFINIRFSDGFYAFALSQILKADSNYGRSKIGIGKKVNVEYVSVNPTGLLHLGHGRNAAIGDTVANLYEFLGYDVTREYYFNNAGNQMKKLADSIYARYMQALGNNDFPFPEDGYHGDYIKDIAKELIDHAGDRFKDGNYQDKTSIRKFGENWCFERIRKTLTRINVVQDLFYNEDTLYKSGKIKEVIDEFKSKGLAYEKDGALWLKLTELGLEDDRVIVKSSGEPTYRLPDIAYHREKFARGYDIIVDLFGADHIATIPDVLAGIKALGYDPEKVKVLIHQFVTLTEDGQQVKMSKRTGKSYTLDDLLDEIGPDVVRFFLIMRSINTHLEFDLNLAREQSDKNPVFYLQYAHARISSIFEKADEQEVKINDEANLKLLTHSSEINLIKKLLKYPDIIESSARKHEPNIVSVYLKDLAASFHIFYHECRILGQDDSLMQARLKLAYAVKIVLFSGLGILGVSAPDKM